MSDPDITTLRLHNQQISHHQHKSVNELVFYMGAMQAQDEHMCRWAVGMRLNNTSLHKIETALDKGEILRTHVMRPTWHLVAKQDIYWMLELTAPNIRKLAKGRHKQLELTPVILAKSRKVIETALKNKKYVTRQDLAIAFAKAKIATNENRLSHLLFEAEMDAVIVNGPLEKGRHTYALLEERVKKKQLLKKDEALAELALRYFTSHGPATLPDFTWWSGLNVTDAKTALNSVKQKLHELKINDAVYWMAEQRKPAAQKRQVFLLPAYDEYLISYKDRSAALKKQHQAKALSINGIFFPIVVVDGQAVGTWKRSFTKDEVLIETKFFGNKPSSLLPLLKKQAEVYAHFTGKKLLLK